MVELPTGTVTFLFTDIEDGGAEGVGPGPGTKLWEQHPKAMPPTAPTMPPHVAAARAALGDEAFAAACAEGRVMTLETAIDYALE